MALIIGTGPDELHAHIDLDHRITAHGGAGTPQTVQVLGVTHDHGHWAVLADVRPGTMGE